MGMTDDQPVHIEGHALTHGQDTRYGGPDSGGWVERIDRDVLERAVAERPTVPLRIGIDGPIIGQAQLSVDDTGLRVTADIEPQGYVQRGVDEGVPYGDRVHDTAAPEALRRGDVDMNATYRVKDQQWQNDATLREISQLSIEGVSLSARPDQERDQ